MVELSIVLCDDSHIAHLNKEWRGEESPTDVLSFPMDDDDVQEVGWHSLVLLADAETLLSFTVFIELIS